MQRQLLTQLAKKVVSWNSVTRVTEFIKIFQTYVKTDLELEEMIYFATQALQVDLSTGIRQDTLKGDGTKTYKGFSYCFLYQAEDILPTLNELVNPYEHPSDRGGSPPAPVIRDKKRADTEVSALFLRLSPQGLNQQIA